MLRYIYNYQVVTQFSQEVKAHALMLRCMPAINACQHVDEEHIVFSPLFRMHRGVDAYGNRTLYGGTRDAHNVVAYVSTGIVSQGEYIIPESQPQPFYKIPSQLTMPSEEIMKETASIPKMKDAYEQAMEISHRVNELMEYVPNSTILGTTASNAFNEKKGVCQDFAHIMIAMCRYMGVPARYVNGFIMGEGETHAWVEVHDGYAWRAVDPTHDTFVCSGYIKLSHGRDAFDCTVDRGTFMGTTQQETKISVTVSEL